MLEILDNSEGQSKIRNLDNHKLEILSEEIREFLIDNISKTGGHLASNLGVVELTLALFKNFNFDEDKVIWDVGHQSYVYKMVTGRMDKFSGLRQHGGLSGFPKACESKYDFFETGHSSTSISAAIGMARARDVLGGKENVIAVIGDGALTGGMALEALNDVGYNKTKIIIILNDNQMSISKNVGGLSVHLSKMRVGAGYKKLKADIHATLDNSNVGKNIAQSLGKIKGGIKQLVVPSMLFEDMGLKYFGPVDGHDMKMLNEVLNIAKNDDGPVVVHIRTQKGKGYNFAEKNPNKFHGVGPFDYSTGTVVKSGSKNYSKAFGDAMIDIASEDKRVVGITAAMPDGTGLKEFSEQFKNRFFDVGIAEQHGTTMAAGMAKTGLKPVFAVYSTFLQRGFDQVLHDVCIQNLPVTFAIDRAGIVGEDGETHQGVFDISYLSLIPNMTVVAPKMMEELKPLLKWAINKDGPVAIRYPRGGDYSNINLKANYDIKLGKWERIKSGDKVAVIATGKMLQHGLLACEEIKSQMNIDIELINGIFIKPIDREFLDDLARRNLKILTIEDNVIKGGFGESILSYLNSINYKNTILNLGYNDKFIEHGKVDILYKENGLDPDSIKDNILKLL
ncbi:MAG: 1-deoxy-D-xylulose-5-phosphate synthase [Sarcina sp.]